ncbi:DUF2332 domain-containing protein [Ponticaulis sp.]|uniref:DUF2332 domain-containing protein n=1 Tax=Ponticaulis sp. TaxID=2020902 RepID=UPI000C56F958|nr:DUF2332 domain-containing protein [Ponticaulis sp.]MAF58381.1 hypothetical protein [Ponticaulis sp.]MBN02576.1 hypothetical protein [Ponticaulis sp.]
MPQPTLNEHFTEQAGWCAELGSPFTAELLRAFAMSLETSGIIKTLVGNWAGNPRADALGLRLAGALHHAVLSGASAELKSVYPTGETYPDFETIWPVVETYLAANADTVTDFIQSPPQTNETRRAFMLLIGLNAIAKRFGKPIHLLELGASAGLNQNFDAFYYDAGSWQWGDQASPMTVTTNWKGPAPEFSNFISIRDRKACDQNPLDLSDEATRLRLKSYVWPDQPERLARFDAAADIAVSRGTKVEKADAADWLERELATRPDDAVTVLFHSVFFQYPPLETRQRMTNLIEAAGARSSDDAPLVWLRYEPELLWNRNAPPLALGMTCDLRKWPGDNHQILARSDGHVRNVEAL